MKAAIQTSIYSQFRGADFSTDPSLIEPSRSPMCTNIMADSGGMPEKRPGWETLHQLSGTVNGLYAGVWGSVTKTLAHVGTKLYLFTDNPETAPVQLMAGLNDHKSRGTFMVGKLWILTGREYICCDGTTAQKVTSGDCYAPLIITGRMPTGGGDPYEDVNLLTPRRKESFLTDGTSKSFKLSGTVDANTATRAWVWGTETTAFTVSGDTVTFTSAPAAPEAGATDGLVIEYSHTVSGAANAINKCDIIAGFGLNGDNRITVSGNPDFPNRDWVSGYNDPTYFPDLGFSVLGSEATEIMGYARVGAYQAIVKRDNGQESTIYLRSGTIGEDGGAVFTTEPAMSGVGAVSKGSFANLLDDPMFAAGTGIHAISVSDMSGNRVTQNRSYFVNPRLTEEELSEAEAVVWNGLYLLSIGNGHVYVLDGRQEKSYRSAALSDYVYEAYYWDSVPARIWLRVENAGEEILYFGTEDGRICRFRTVNGRTRYADDDEPIRAVWATKYDDNGTPSRYKTMLKKGCCVTLKPQSRSSGVVYIRTDKSGTEQAIARGEMDIFDWEDIDFERFTFNGDDSPREIYLQKKINKYKRIQIIVRNEQINEGFGIFQIVVHYVYGNFSKPTAGQSIAPQGGEAEEDERVNAGMKAMFESIFGSGTWLEEEEEEEGG